jgi:AAA domain
LIKDNRRVTAKQVKAVLAGARLLLAGDVGQLPRAGASEVLRDLLAAGTIPRVRLTQIFRQARQSGIGVTPTASTTASTRSSPASATFTGSPASLPGTPPAPGGLSGAPFHDPFHAGGRCRHYER